MKTGFCSRHRTDIAQRLKFLGLWDKVKATNTEITTDIARAWLAGELRREMLCPLVVMLLELQAKANRMAGGHVTNCPVCAIQRLSDDETADIKVIKGVGLLVLALMQTNGLAGGQPSPLVLRHQQEAYKLIGEKL